MIANTAPHPAVDEAALIAELFNRARTAQQRFAGADQKRTDEAVTAVAWSLYKPEHARELAELAVADTGLGNVADKIIKNQRKTFGTLRDLMRVKTVGVIERNEALGLTKYAKPVGVVAAITPSTNPAATPVNKTLMALKGRNAIVIAPSPAGWTTTARAVGLMRAALERIGQPADLVQLLPQPVTRSLTEALMRACDLVVATGSQNNVRSAYQSGTPAIGVGVGNVPVIVAADAELDAAAEKIAASKCFDNATSCSSENALIVVDEVYQAMLTALGRAGGWLLDGEQKQRLQNVLWQNGKLNRQLIATDLPVLAKAAGLPASGPPPPGARFLLVEESGIGPQYPFSDEKLALVLSIYRATDFDHAAELTRRILDFKGRGHSCGVHTQNPELAARLAERLDVVRVLVNQAHTFGNGGGFESGLNFTLSMGCGTWGGNSISENLNYRHFINLTHLVTSIPTDKPDESVLFGDHWARYGRD